MPLHVVGSHACYFVSQPCPCLRAAVTLRQQLAQHHLGIGPQLGHVGGAAFDILGEGIGEQVLDVLEVIGGGRQWHTGLGGDGAVAHATYAIAHDNAHGGVEDQLATLFAALAGSLAALVLHAFGDGGGDAGGALVRHCGCHWGYLMDSVSSVPASSRLKPLPQVPHYPQAGAVPVGAALAAKRPVLTT
ncbi:protein of unknown function [Pseudomonas inefficax]|uniref:Uncharacterized protein n=1 Tax=Pseudomonas inefficax TaxID=2078786 RepID=A0AAQ1P4R0_9PSED|nr:protein of unknown function [Pseudomonas inefficax]